MVTVSINLTEKIILENLIYNLPYTQTMVGFLKSDWFEEDYKYVFDNIIKHFNKYAVLPTKDVLKLDIDNDTTLTDKSFKATKDIVNSLDNTTQDFKWLCDTTEAWGRDRAIYNGVTEAIDIMSKEKENKKSKKSSGEIPSILSDAISTSIDRSVGHDYIDDSDKRFIIYHTQEDKIPFGLDMFNKITNGGLSKKTLNILLGGTGGCKTLTKCHMASDNLTMGYNVLYITLEMSEEKIAERIDANLLDVDIDDIALLDKPHFNRKLSTLKSQKIGRLKIKEYPTASATANNFRFLLNELRLKQQFVPDIIYVDYVNICSSFRINASQTHNTFVYVKAIAEELRGLGQEFDVPVVSSSQLNREGYDSTNPSLTNTSESFGLPFTADLMLAIIAPEELRLMNQIRFKQLKNRYNDTSNPSSFLVGCDIKKFRLYDIKQSVNQSDDKKITDKKYGGLVI